jgi:hypothetical protein
LRKFGAIVLFSRLKSAKFHNAENKDKRSRPEMGEILFLNLKPSGQRKSGRE